MRKNTGIKAVSAVLAGVLMATTSSAVKKNRLRIMLF